MSDDPEEPESRAGEAKPPQKAKAEDNPWYLLATLYGVPDARDQELKDRNRHAWNRYFSRELDESRRTQLIAMGRHSKDELTPFSPEERRGLEEAFAKRCKGLDKAFALPRNDSEIDFSNVQFDQDVAFAGCLLVNKADFDGASFLGNAGFDGATFFGIAKFENSEFLGVASFTGAAFAGPAIFQGANFTALTLFGYATFYSMAYFSGVTFSRANAYGDASFARAKFYGEANFLFTSFGGRADFEKAEFFRTVGFLKAIFARLASFDHGTFFDDASFDAATFSAKTVFADATFEKSASFVNTKIKGETFFEGVTFKREPPKFFGAKLHQGTVWRGIKRWPTPRKTDKPGPFIDAYACLKLEMDRLKKHEDELDFFALELQSRRVLLGPWRGILLPPYGLLSDYGRSYVGPLWACLMVAAIGTLLLVPSGVLSPWQSLGLSFANTFNVFGFRKDFFDFHCIENLPAATKILAAVQTVLGTIFLFLFGLGIRNKFRMK